ncbi:MAG: hypothetical protein K0R38_1622 [Polyangiaceae bacterium]|nr:hypothetical protein [Polyangiaceae bacterium]
MSQATARRSFHGPLISTLLSPARRPLGSRARELAPPSPRVSGVTTAARAVLWAARQESPSTSQRERVLAGVLSALQRLTAQGTSPTGRPVNEADG